MTSILQAWQGKHKITHRHTTLSKNLKLKLSTNSSLHAQRYLLAERRKGVVVYRSLAEGLLNTDLVKLGTQNCICH